MCHGLFAFPLGVYCIVELPSLPVMGFNDTSSLVGHFVSSPRERGKRDSRGNEREGQGRKRNRNESEETEEIKAFPGGGGTHNLLITSRTRIGSGAKSCKNVSHCKPWAITERFYCTYKIKHLVWQSFNMKQNSFLGKRAVTQFTCVFTANTWIIVLPFHNVLQP